MQKMRCKGSIFILITVHMRPFKIYYLTYFRTKIQYTGPKYLVLIRLAKNNILSLLLFKDISIFADRKK